MTIKFLVPSKNCQFSNSIIQVDKILSIKKVYSEISFTLSADSTIHTEVWTFENPSARDKEYDTITRILNCSGL